MNIVRYNSALKSDWNDFINKSKNGHFIFERDYMDYHSDRYVDHSVMIYDTNQKLLAIMPLNEKDQYIYSHQGLTFGGVIFNEKVKTVDVLEFFKALRIYFIELGFERLLYKCVPYIYHTMPEEDRYVLFINDAKLIRRDVTSTVDLHRSIKYSKEENGVLKKLKRKT